MLHRTDKHIKFEDKDFQWQYELCAVGLDVHSEESTAHFQTFDPDVPWLESFAGEKFEKYAISIIKQMPGKLIPHHIDQYHFFKSKHNLNDASMIRRINIFLEDWKNGHYFEAGGKPVVEWMAGSYVVLDNTIEHMSANMGRVPKYTAQITGLPWEGQHL